MGPNFKKKWRPWPQKKKVWTQQAILVHIDTISKMELHLKDINPSDLDNNADSDLSTKFTTKFQRPFFKLQDHIWDIWIY